MKTQTTHRGTEKQAYIPSEAHSGTAVSNGKSASSAKSSFGDRHAHITARAYELYVQGGRRDGCAMEDWLEAERESVHPALSV